MADLIEHSNSVVHGITLVDATFADGTRHVWVGHYDDGRWLTPAQFREFAVSVAEIDKRLQELPA